MTGRAPSGQALVASDEARSDLHPPGFDPSRIAIGDWVLFPGWRFVDVGRVECATPKLVYIGGGSWRARQYKRASLIASFPNEEPARLLAQALDGALGQRNDRIRKAREDFDERKASACAAYDKIAERLIASAMSAGTGAAEGESATLEEGDANA